MRVRYIDDDCEVDSIDPKEAQRHHQSKRADDAVDDYDAERDDVEDEVSVPKHGLHLDGFGAEEDAATDDERGGEETSTEQVADRSVDTVLFSSRRDHRQDVWCTVCEGEQRDT